jgi:hypothetical protein
MASSLRTKIAYNTAKHRALEALARHPDKWWRVADWASAASIYPTRRMYTYALRLAHYQLVTRAYMNGQIVYRLAAAGVKRLAWLGTSG